MNNKIITIGRQFGSGGREIGKAVAEKLGITYYDKELLGIAAKESGLSTEFLESYDERTNGSLLYNLVMGQSALYFNTNANTSVEQLASKAQREAVLSVAGKSDCVIVGRCADYILRDEPHVLRVFISADDDYRINHVMKRDSFTEAEAKDKIKTMDKTRKAYYNFHADAVWGEARYYDVCFNVAKLGNDKVVEAIVDLYKNI